MTKSAAIRRELYEISQRAIELRENLTHALGNEYYTCPKCMSRSRIKSVSVISKYCYIEPYGCSSGDYFTHDRYMIMCPKCNNVVERITEYDKDRIRYITEYSNSFLEILKWYPSSYDPELTLEWLRRKQKDYKV